MFKGYQIVKSLISSIQNVVLLKTLDSQVQLIFSV